MGITIGDSLAVVATLAGIGLSTWALVVAMSLIMPGKTKASHLALRDSTWKSLISGTIILLTVGVFSFAMATGPNPPAKLLGTFILLWLLSHSAIGAAGLARLAAERVATMDNGMSQYRALVRGAGFLVVAGFLPFLGWFVFAPLMLIAATGAGFVAVFKREGVSVPEI